MTKLFGEAVQDLETRDLIMQLAGGEDLKEHLASASRTLYCGFDPTAESLHIGNLIPLLALRRFQLAGHRPIVLVGGATGMIGDPSFKTSERQLNTLAIVDDWVERIKPQLSQFLDFDCGANSAVLVNNLDWIQNYDVLSFLRDIGKHFSINSMIQKESVRQRIEREGEGISFTEFTYMILQSYDFRELNNRFECTLQIGGSDQWGNITAGIELSRRKLNTTVYGLTLPLITNADGTKFGKTEAGAVWLDPARTSVYKFYQFWIRTDDRDVVRYLKYFTFLPQERITELEASHTENPSDREAHTALAVAMTDLIHGEAATQEAQQASRILFGGGLDGIGESTFNEIVGEVPTVEIKRTQIEGDGMPILELFVTSGLCQSNGQARKDLQGGGINLNNERQSDAQTRVTAEQLLFGKHLLLRKGKRNYTVITAK